MSPEAGFRQGLAAYSRTVYVHMYNMTHMFIYKYADVCTYIHVSYVYVYIYMHIRWLIARGCGTGKATALPGRLEIKGSIFLN